MVTKGLKVGDSFTDGNSRYRVKKVLHDGSYISARIGTIDAETPSEMAGKESEEEVNATDKAEAVSEKKTTAKRTTLKQKTAKNDK